MAQLGRAFGLGHKIVVPKIITYYIISGNGLVWFRALGLGPRDFGGSNPPYPTIFNKDSLNIRRWHGTPVSTAQFATGEIPRNDTLYELRYELNGNQDP